VCAWLMVNDLLNLIHLAPRRLGLSYGCASRQDICSCPSIA
jgi:hypothetical protein